ncbi:HU family DNA-binding protein [Alistipes finegoldii]|uniref:HU family DNA-binding protein n=1 Tax=Alistipes finegoldii TaxID=214856 RepID=UPI002431C877|nr:HU family DNA-binding protein [Alistipes finegoldii]
MTKADIVSRIIEQTGVEKATALAVVESFMEQVKNALTDGESVYLRGFGTFLIKQRAAKTARNISTNTTIIVPAHSMPAFKPSTEFASKIK